MLNLQRHRTLDDESSPSSACLLDSIPKFGRQGSGQGPKQPLVYDGFCLGLSDICPSRETDAARDTGLRAGVGQTSREETAACAPVVRWRYGAMAN
jgi:hypothetical protein